MRGKPLKDLAAPRDSNPDMLIQSRIPATENKADQQTTSEESGKVRQNPQPTRNRKSPS